VAADAAPRRKASPVVRYGLLRTRTSKKPIEGKSISLFPAHPDRIHISRHLPFRLSIFAELAQRSVDDEALRELGVPAEAARPTSEMLLHQETPRQR
jgi:hypothetical protein